MPDANQKTTQSKYWEVLNKSITSKLEKHGYGNFKRTIAFHYFTWLVPFKNCQINFLRKNLPFGTVGKSLIKTIFTGKFDLLTWGRTMAVKFLTLYKGGEHADTNKETVEELVGRLNLKNVKILAGTFPDETARYIDENEKFRFCHIDVDVYQGAKEITEWVWPRLVPGGMIVYDDYAFFKFDGMRKAVDEMGEKDDRITFQNLNGHAVAVKIK